MRAAVAAAPSDPGFRYFGIRRRSHRHAFARRRWTRTRWRLLITRAVSTICTSRCPPRRDFRIEPSLSTSWQAADPRTWRFTLRQRVSRRQPLLADAVVSRLSGRAATSQRSFQLKASSTSGSSTRDDDFRLERPIPWQWPRSSTSAVMSLAGDKHRQLPQDFNWQRMTFAVRKQMPAGRSCSSAMSPTPHGAAPQPALVAGPMTALVQRLQVVWLTSAPIRRESFALTGGRDRARPAAARRRPPKADGSLVLQTPTSPAVPFLDQARDELAEST